MRTLHTLYIKGQPVQAWGYSRADAFDTWHRQHQHDRLIAAEHEPDDPPVLFTTSERLSIAVCPLFGLFFVLPDFIAWYNGQPPVGITRGR